MKETRKMVNRSPQDRRRAEKTVWEHKERRRQREERKDWVRTGEWSSTHKPLKEMAIKGGSLFGED